MSVFIVWAGGATLIGTPYLPPLPPPPPHGKSYVRLESVSLKRQNAEFLCWADGSFLPRCVLGFLRFNQILVFVTRHGHTSISRPYCSGPWEYQFRSSAQYTEKDAIKGINIVFPFCCGLLACYSSVFCLGFAFGYPFSLLPFPTPLLRPPSLPSSFSSSCPPYFSPSFTH